MVRGCQDVHCWPLLDKSTNIGILKKIIAGTQVFIEVARRLPSAETQSGGDHDRSYETLYSEANASILHRCGRFRRTLGHRHWCGLTMYEIGVAALLISGISLVYGLMLWMEMPTARRLQRSA